MIQCNICSIRVVSIGNSNINTNDFNTYNKCLRMMFEIIKFSMSETIFDLNDPSKPFIRNLMHRY